MKIPVGDIKIFKFYPTMKKNKNGVPIHSDFIMKKGYFHKYKFLVENKVTKFPGQYLDFMVEESEKGPYVLEVKTNGNVILYPKNNPNNPLWTTNTANKGKGPYNLHWTNEKKLILEDSTGRILYQSDDYKEAPTIFYGNNGENGDHISNGYELDNPNTKSFNLKIDNNNFNINYHAKHLEVREGPAKIYGDFDYKPILNEGLVNLFSAKISSDDFDICYTAYVIQRGWTMIACNGANVGFMPAVADLNYETNYI